MHRRALWASVGLVLVAILVAANLQPAPRVQADQLWQDSPPSLEGRHIYFSEASGEASRFDRGNNGLSRFAGLLELLGAELYTLEWRTGIPADADLIVIAGPAKDLTPDQIAWLWSYLQGGGRLLLLAEPPFAPYGAFKAKAGLFQLMWDDMGMRARDDIVAVESGEIRQVIPPTPKPVADQPTPAPGAPVDSPVLMTGLLATNLSSAHPILNGVAGPLYFSGARSLELDSAPRESQVTPLVYSGSEAYGETDYVTYLQTGFVQYNIDLDTTRTALPLAAAMEDIAAGTRIVLVADRDFATNGIGFQTSPPFSGSFLYPDNVRFVVNAASWLLEAEPVAAQFQFPTPGPTVTPTTTPSPTPSPAPTGAPANPGS